MLFSFNDPRENLRRHAQSARDDFGYREPHVSLTGFDALHRITGHAGTLRQVDLRPPAAQAQLTDSRGQSVAGAANVFEVRFGCHTHMWAQHTRWVKHNFEGRHKRRSGVLVPRGEQKNAPSTQITEIIEEGGWGAFRVSL